MFVVQIEGRCHATLLAKRRDGMQIATGFGQVCDELPSLPLIVSYRKAPHEHLVH